MTIECPQCGRSGPLAKGPASHVTIRCPRCGTTFTAVQEEPPEPVPASRPWFKDPILQFAVAVPVVALIGFGAYLMHQHMKVRARQDVIAWKTEGDQLVKSGRLRQALDKYEAAVARGDGSSDSDVQTAVAQGKAARDKLLVTLRAELEREEAEQKRQAEEAQRLARLKAQAEREAIARQAAEEERLKKEAELAKINASLSGGAWVIKGGGQSDILRGLSIYVLRADLARRELEAAVDVMKSDPDFDRYGGDARRLPACPPDERISLRLLYGGVRFRKDDEASDSSKMRRIKSDLVWPAIVARALVASAETNIDGKYKIPEIKGGTYLVYAIHDTRFSLIEWVVPLEITHPGEALLDLYNKNAEEILNRSDDD